MNRVTPGFGCVGFNARLLRFWFGGTNLLRACGYFVVVASALRSFGLRAWLVAFLWVFLLAWFGLELEFGPAFA